MSTSVEETIEGQAVEVYEEGPGRALALQAQSELTVEELVAQSGKIEAAMKSAMTQDMHYGIIPGVKKPSLFKPGAEKLCVLFRLAPHYQSEKIWHADGHLTVTVVCSLKHAPTGITIATGEGLCTSRESRYAYRQGERLCPSCGEPQVRLGKARGNKAGNWYCWKKQGGCGETWALDSPEATEFEKMETGKVANPEIPDTFNTVLKMADKRALVAAVLNATAASDVFTQDVEDMGQRAAATAAEETAAEQPAATDEEFRPGFHLLPDAPKNLQEIQDVIMALDRELLDWVAEAVVLMYGCSYADLTTDETRKEAGLRIANCVARIASELYAQGDFPPPTDDQYREVFAWAFEGLRVRGPREIAAEAAALDEAAREAALDHEGDTSEAAAAGTDGQERDSGAEPGQDSLPEAQTASQGHVGTGEPDL